MKPWTIIFLLLVNANAFARSYGVVGEVFPIGEKSLLTLIQERLKILSSKGQLKDLKQAWIEKTADHINRPKACNLSRTLKNIKHYHTPETTLSQDIRDAQGSILYPQGTHVNALEQLPWYQPCWLFFNAVDKAQVYWAKKQRCINPKYILTGGAIREAEEQLQAVIYFDQVGLITKKLMIQHVPAIVTRSKNQLLILEQAIKENGDVL